ncbi:ABC transporter ATP-binding protein [Actinoplanes sp. NPDC049668]|uniref:ABC transporter ATP-binding protein n=1 Tax=unclassified Actinoplanes TaxID=2626549 RepID=UPI0033A1132D
MVAIAARELTKTFDDVVAVDHVDLDVSAGEFLVLLGPTGCGKSTLLRLLAGIEVPTSGAVLFDGVPVRDIDPRARGIAMVFQDHALYPHLTVAQNIGFPLRTVPVPATDIGLRVAEAARNVGVADLLSRYPEHLSGGQRQRVAMARALVRNPSVFLLDEPLSNVDAGARSALRGEIVALARRLGVTTVYVTHDQIEAISMADRVAVLRYGVLQQVGPPAEVYADPDTLFVAAFLGTPRTSLLEAAVYAEDCRTVLDLGSQVLELPAGDPRTAVLARHHTERVTVALRALSLGTRAMTLRGAVCAVENLGHELLAHVDVGGVPSPWMQPPPARAAAPAERTPYGFYPAYDVVDPPPMGEVMVRVPMPGRVVRGEELAVGVGLDDLLLFDRGGRRIRFAAG